MNLEDCIRSICILVIIFGYTFLFILLGILSTLRDIKKELRGKTNDRKL